MLFRSTDGMIEAAKEIPNIVEDMGDDTCMPLQLAVITDALIALVERMDVMNKHLENIVHSIDEASSLQAPR